MGTQATACDVIVIGTGGGLRIARAAAAMGLRTVLCDEDACGGTCLNRGCIPSKMLIYPAEASDLIRDAANVDVRVSGTVTVDYPAVVSRTSDTVDGISTGIRDSLADADNLTFLPAHAEFVEDHTVRVGDRLVSAPRIFIATGSRPSIPDIPGLGATPYMTSRELLRRKRQPKRLIVLGAGYIAAELGYACRGMGSEVEFVVRSRFLRGEDREIATTFERVFERHHKIHRGFHPVSVAYADDTFNLVCRHSDGEERVVTGDALLVATGVRPNSDRLGLETTSVATSEDGYIIADPRLQTTAPGVYTLGDIVGNYLYRHTVNYEAEYLVRTALQGEAAGDLNYGPVPHAVFGHPQIAGVGATQEQLDEQGSDYVIGRASYADSNQGIARGLDHGLVKILVDRTSRRVLGAHILGAEASDMIHLFIVLMKKEGTLDDLLDTIFIHPALPEVARDAARDAAQALNRV